MTNGGLRAFLALLWAGFLFAAGAPAAAIVVRHDADPRAYHASPSDYPAVFGLLRTRRGFWDCPATLIAPNWAITAGHCAEAPRIQEGVANGGFAVEIAGAANMIDRVVRHPQSDVALLRLSSAVTNARPALLYAGADEVGQVVSLLGWGDTGTGQTGVAGPDGQFRLARNKVDRAEADLISWSFSDPADSNGDIVDLEGVAGPGDSGGPAFLMTENGMVLLGVSSGQDGAGRGPGRYGAREYYVRISAVRAWVVETAGLQR